MRWMNGLANALKQRQQIAELSEATPALKAWFATDVGQRLLGAEQQAIDKALSCLFGYHLLQMSVLPGAKLYQNSRICHCCRIGVSEREPEELASRFDALPLGDESVDVTLVHHALDFSENPHQLLSEVSRVTIAHGHIVIVGFDPASLTGAIKPFAQLARTSAFWLRHSLRKGRINDWLKLLGFETLSVHTGASHRPFSRRLSGRLGAQLQLPFGHFYCIVARKSVASIRPIKPQWENPLLDKVKLAQPLSARNAARLSLIRNVGDRRRPRDR